MVSEVDLSEFVATPELTVAAARSQARREQRQARRFLRGPVPWDWLDRAAALGGHALAVAIALRFWQGIARGANVIEVSLAQLAIGSAHRNTTRRGVLALEGAGLIRIERRCGKPVRIQFLDPAVRPEPRPQSEPALPLACPS